MAAEKDSPASSLFDAWTETLKVAASPFSAYATMLEDWRDAAGGAPQKPANEAGQAPEAPAAGDFVRTFVGGQQAILRMSELAADTVRSMALPGASAADAESSLKRGLDEFARKLTTSPLLNGLDVWNAAASGQHQLAEPWTELMQRMIGVAAAMGAPSGAGDPLGDALERSFGVLADFPGINKELPSLVRAAAANALALTRARETYRIIMAATWQRAFEEIVREALRRAADGKPVGPAAALLALSTSVSDRVFVETFNSPRYIEAQQQLSTALAEQRANEARVVDLFARLGHFPTRRDYDDVLREIGALRREVHALKRSLRTRTTTRPEAAAAAAAPPEHGAASGAVVAPKPPAKRRAQSKAPRNGTNKPKKRDRGE